MAATSASAPERRLVLKRSPLDAPDAMEESLLACHRAYSTAIATALGGGGGMVLVDQQVKLQSVGGGGGGGGGGGAAATGTGAAGAGGSASAFPGSTSAGMWEALVYRALTADPPAGPPLWTLIAFVSRDEYAGFTSTLRPFVATRTDIATEPVRKQLVWLLGELMTVNAKGIEDLLIDFIRHLECGDTGSRNCSLIRGALQLFFSHKKWLVQTPLVIPHVFYSMLRLACDHDDVGVKPLQDTEMTLCCDLWKAARTACMAAGRDVVRLFVDYSLDKRPGLAPIWTSLQTPAEGGGPTTTPLHELMQTRTPAKIVASRVTPEAQNQLLFILKNVKLGMQRRYQIWFATRFLSGRQSDGIVCDLVRFIIVGFHPNNKLLQSQVVPRWALLGWILTCCKTPEASALARSALVFDWLWFEPSTSIMLAEPGLLLMARSMPKYVDMTASLMHALVDTSGRVDPSNQDLYRARVALAFNECLRVGVLRTLAPLGACEALSPPDKEVLRSICPALYRTGPPPPAAGGPGGGGAAGHSTPSSSGGAGSSASGGSSSAPPGYSGGAASSASSGSASGGAGPGGSAASSPASAAHGAPGGKPAPLKRGRDAMEGAAEEDAGPPRSKPTLRVDPPAVVSPSVSPASTSSAQKSPFPSAVTLPKTLQFLAGKVTVLSSSIGTLLKSGGMTPVGRSPSFADGTGPAPSTPYDAMQDLLGLVLEAARQAPGRAHTIARDLGTVLGQVLLSELASPGLVPAPSSALACLFDTLHHACGLEVLRPPKAGASTAGAGAGAVVDPVSTSLDKRGADPLAARALATVIAAAALTNASASSSGGDSEESGALQPAFPYRTVGPRLLAYALHVGCSGGSAGAVPPTPASSSLKTDAARKEGADPSGYTAYLSALVRLEVEDEDAGLALEAAASAHTGLAPEIAAQRLAADMWAVADVDALYGASIAASLGVEEEEGGEGADDRANGGSLLTSLFPSNWRVTVPSAQLTAATVDLVVRSALVGSKTVGGPIVPLSGSFTALLTHSHAVIRFLCSHCDSGALRSLRKAARSGHLQLFTPPCLRGGGSVPAPQVLQEMGLAPGSSSGTFKPGTSGAEGRWTDRQLAAFWTVYSEEVKAAAGRAGGKVDVATKALLRPWLDIVAEGGAGGPATVDSSLADAIALALDTHFPGLV